MRKSTEGRDMGKCQHCGREIVPVVHGMPTPEAEQAAREGRAILGGCCVFGDERDFPRACVKCGRPPPCVREVVASAA